MRMIDADALLNGREFIIIGSGDNVCIDIADIENAPTIEAEPVKHGRWEERDRSGIAIRGFMVCSRCGVMMPVASVSRYCLSRLNFCPNCGAKMDEEDEA